MLQKNVNVIEKNDDRNKSVYSNNEILGALWKFYENLYTSQLPLNEEISTYINETAIKSKLNNYEKIIVILYLQ